MEQGKGIFYTVGVGPGDPELLTRKAVRILSECPVIAAPRTRSGGTLALDIVRQVVPLEGKQLLTLQFSMERKPDQWPEAHRRAADEIQAQLEAGRSVAMPNLGDVSLYATGSYLTDLLRERGCQTVMVPGVPSFCAVAACLGDSLTRGDVPLHVIPAGEVALEGALDLPGTKVLMKAGSRMDQVFQALERRGLLERSALVQDCGLPTQRVFPDLSRPPEDTGYFSTIVVKESVS